MRIATIALMGMAGFVLALLSVVLLQEITSEDPVGTQPYCSTYKWDNGRLVKSCD